MGRRYILTSFEFCCASRKRELIVYYDVFPDVACE